jgi:hypothetical protein
MPLGNGSRVRFSSLRNSKCGMAVTLEVSAYVQPHGVSPAEDALKRLVT